MVMVHLHIHIDRRQERRRRDLPQIKIIKFVVDPRNSIQCMRMAIKCTIEKLRYMHNIILSLKEEIMLVQILHIDYHRCRFQK
jgi:hypothetical protein